MYFTSTTASPPSPSLVCAETDLAPSSVPIEEGGGRPVRRFSFEHMARLCHLGERVDLAPGRTVLRQGDAPSSFYLLLSGQVELRRSLTKGRELSLGRIPAGGHFGEASLIDGGPQMATVRSLESCQLLEFKSTRFFGLLVDDKVFSMAIIAGLVERVRTTRAKAANLALLEVPERTLACLVELAQRDRTGGRTVSPMPSHGEIAAQIGSTRSSVTRALGKLERAGRIVITGDSAILLDEVQAPSQPS